MIPPQKINLQILSSKEKKKIEKQLNLQFGIKNIPGLIIKRGKERLFLFSGNFSEREIFNLNSTVFIERTGVYFAKQENNEMRLSIEGTQILRSQITKNFVELEREELVEKWMHGNELLLEDLDASKKSGEVADRTGTSRTRKFQKGFVAIKYQDDFLGCGKASAEKITNFIPKNRRLKNKVN